MERDAERKGRLWLERGLSHGFTAVFCADTDVLQAEIRDEEKLPYLLAEVRSAQGSFVNEVREQTGRHAEDHFGMRASGQPGKAAGICPCALWHLGGIPMGEASFLWRAAQC